MEIGPVLPQAGAKATRDLVLRTARAAEDAGYDALWAFDHVVYPREFTSKYLYSADGKLPSRVTADGSALEPLTELAFVAAATSRIRIGTSVLILPMRHPVLHAKIIASIDHLAGGRFILGAGAGWAREEFEVLGMSFDNRGPRFDESIRILRALWSGDFVDFEGEFHAIDGWTSRPAPMKPIPIWVGGDTVVARKRAGRLGDGWLTHGYRIPTVREDFEVVREAAAAAGRDPVSLTLAMTGITTLGRDRLEAAAEALHRAKEAGIQHATVGVERTEIEDAPELLEQFAARYLQELQSEPERSLR